MLDSVPIRVVRQPRREVPTEAPRAGHPFGGAGVCELWIVQHPFDGRGQLVGALGIDHLHPPNVQFVPEQQSVVVRQPLTHVGVAPLTLQYEPQMQK